MGEKKKKAKILLAIFLIITFSKEAYSGYRETGNFWLFAGLALASLIGGGLLIRNALKPVRGMQIENKYSNYTWSFVMIFSIFGILASFFGPSSPPRSVIVINGKKIPLDNCISGTRNMIEDSAQRKEYCSCIAMKIANYKNLPPGSIHLLEKGQFDAILTKIKEQGNFLELGIDSCFSSTATVSWTDNIKEQSKKQLRIELKANGWDSIVNIDNYCDCLLESFVKQPAAEVLSGRFSQTYEFLVLDSVCKEKSKKRIE
ncbi:MAG TPA: hypothetical protein VGC65_00055 [Bacteroidia bacterium]|jgi:hypothetical protein